LLPGWLASFCRGTFANLNLMVRTVVWDWNGTLLDDVEPSVATLNVLRARRDMPPMSREDYRRTFGFPVRAFYESIGFDFSVEDYLALSADFIAEYRRRAPEMRVASGARAALQRLSDQGVVHLVVSAMEARLLGEMIQEHGLEAAIGAHFGTSDHGAGSKIDVGAEAARVRALDPSTTVVVGDTLHDLDLARALGCRALLYAGGHQHRDRLAAEGGDVGTVIDNFDQLDHHFLHQVLTSVGGRP
jgi:phosphoglycolate phosphatase